MGSDEPDFLYFRLDSSFSHILMDEFQDTSLLQYIKSSGLPLSFITYVFDWLVIAEKKAKTIPRHIPS